MATEGHEFTPKDAQLDEDRADMLFQRESRWCSCLPRFGSLRLGGGGAAAALLKVREWTEIAAGPKWKTFIRRFNRIGNKTGGGGGVRHGKFQYDPLSYALNFDEGDNNNGDMDEEEYLIRGNFSMRYAVASSVDLGMDAPPSA